VSLWRNHDLGIDGRIGLLPRESEREQTVYDGLFDSADIQAAKPVFKQVVSYGFKHPLRVLFNPQYPAVMWVTSFRNGLNVGDTVP
jgi:hypothetical protein